MPDAQRKLFSLLLIVGVNADGEKVWYCVQRKDGTHPRETHRHRLTFWGGSWGYDGDSTPLEVLSTRLAQQFVGSDELRELVESHITDEPLDLGPTMDGESPTHHLIYVAPLSEEILLANRAELQSPSEGYGVMLRAVEMRALLANPDCWLPGVPEVMARFVD